MERLLVIFSALMLFTVGFFVGSCHQARIDYDKYGEAPYNCTTDEDCMRHCPPPSDDPDCDGGPQS